MSTSFSADITRFVRRANMNVHDAVYGLLYGIGAKVVKSTPVLTGQARGNWIVSMGSNIEKRKTGVLDKSGEHSLNRIATELQKFKVGETKVIWISNTLPYIIPLEYGWSKKSPNGMVRLTLLNYAASKKWFRLESIGFI